MKRENALITISSAFYLCSLLFNALDRAHEIYPATGFEILILGAFGIFAGLVSFFHGGAIYLLPITPWFANPLLFVCVYLTYKQKYRNAEPLRELFKDEVRKIVLEVGLPYEMVYRHPFPGPGLGVRILGEVKKEYADILRRADAIFLEELRKHNLYDKVSQAFAVFLPVRSVGVMGDGRRYDYVIALRAVETVDFMTAHWAHLPYEVLATISNRIINEVPGISRVTYDISGKPPATIEWE